MNMSKFTVIDINGNKIVITAYDFEATEDHVCFITRGDIVAYFRSANIIGFTIEDED